MSFDVSHLADHFSPKLPRKAFAIFFFLICLFLVLAWTGANPSPILLNTNPILENTTTMVIQAMDLGLVVPLAFLSGLSVAEKQWLGLSAQFGPRDESRHNGIGCKHNGHQYDAHGHIRRLR